MSKRHPLFKRFMAALRKAIFIESEEDLERVKQTLISRGMTEEEASKLDNRYLVSNQYIYSSYNSLCKFHLNH